MRRFPHLVLNHLGGSRVLEPRPDIAAEPVIRDVPFRRAPAGTGTPRVRNFHRHIEALLR